MMGGTQGRVSPRPASPSASFYDATVYSSSWAAGAGGAGAGSEDGTARNESRRRALAAVTLLHFRRLVALYGEKKERALALAKINRHRCRRRPLFGADLIRAVTLTAHEEVPSRDAWDKADIAGEGGEVCEGEMGEMGEMGEEMVEVTAPAGEGDGDTML